MGFRLVSRGMLAPTVLVTIFIPKKCLKNTVHNIIGKILGPWAPSCLPPPYAPLKWVSREGGCPIQLISVFLNENLKLLQ